MDRWLAVDDLAQSKLRGGQTDHLSWYMPISIGASERRVWSKGTASRRPVIWFTPQ